MFLKIGGTFVVLIAAFFTYVSFQPSDFLVSRELHIKAKPEIIFPYINNSKLTNEWMPWKDSDPSVEMVYAGPGEGVGSIASWDSKGQMGTGKAEVVESVPNQAVKTQLTYTKPMEMHQMAEMTLTAKEDGTVVKWTVSGQKNFISKVMCTFVNMDKMVGGEFEKGLLKLQALVEKSSNTK